MIVVSSWYKVALTIRYIALAHTADYIEGITTRIRKIALAIRLRCRTAHAVLPTTAAHVSRACANSKILIFRFDGEGEHKSRLQNICSPTERDASRHDGPRPDGRGPSCRIVSRCVGVNILQSILVFTLSVNAKYKYFAICGWGEWIWGAWGLASVFRV